MTTINTRHRRHLRLSAPICGGAVLLFMIVACLVLLPWSISLYNKTQLDQKLCPPFTVPTTNTNITNTTDTDIANNTTSLLYNAMGTDALGRSLLARCALGGIISLGIGFTAAAISVIIGTTWGMISGYAGGKIDMIMMRIVDILYGLPYILLVVLLSVAFQPILTRLFNPLLGNVITLLIAIGAVSWLTLARVVRGQVLSLRAQPFIEAAQACGVNPARILFSHVLPNLIGPIIVYTTLTVPQAILQESFLSFLGIGVQAPLPSWGNLASVGVVELNPVKSHWWLLVWPCVSLGLTLLSLNFLGDGLRDRFDPKTIKNH